MGLGGRGGPAARARALRDTGRERLGALKPSLFRPGLGFVRPDAVPVLWARGRRTGGAG